MADAERAHIVATLRETNWVVGGPDGAAARLGLPRTSLIARMNRLGLGKLPAGQTQKAAAGDGEERWTAVDAKDHLARNTVHLTILIRWATSSRRVRWRLRGRRG